jgi:hypothetical protein
MIIQYSNMNKNKYKQYVLQNWSSEHIILKFYSKIVECFHWIKISIFFMRSYLLYSNSLSVPLKIVLHATIGTRAIGYWRLV